MDANFIATTLQTIGHVMIAYTAISVHYRFRKEHKVDDKLFKVMKREQIIGIVGVLFILAGYAFHIV